MRHNIWIAGALLLLLIGCRRESDNVLSYAFIDNMAFEKADSSFAAKFDVVWHGMNTNYALWDFEAENGLDWDAIYDEYYPRFAELDAVDTLVSDKQLLGLLAEATAQLHDGHLVIRMRNHNTGKYVSVSPVRSRVNWERADEFKYAKSFKPSLAYYASSGQMLEHQEASSQTFMSTYSKVIAYIIGKRMALQAKASLTPEEAELLALYNEIYGSLLDALRKIESDNDMAGGIALFNEIALRYEYLHIPGLVKVEQKLNENPIEIRYALFDGNIAYLNFSGFLLSAFLDPEYTEYLYGKPSESSKAIIDDVAATWKAWFNAIQAHHKAGDLGGVIIDIRTNGGGFVNDFQYVIGALLPSGSFRVTNARFKRGPGRYDYSPVMPQFMATMKDEHVTVTEPIVVLCNCSSVSMAEQTSLAAKLLANGTLIGTRTWGALSALAGSDDYSNNYAGYVGEDGKTSVFCYIPQEVAITQDGKILEGYGVTPDIEVPLDFDAWMSGNGPDSQLDRALQFIRTGK